MEIRFDNQRKFLISTFNVNYSKQTIVQIDDNTEMTSLLEGKFTMETNFNMKDIENCMLNESGIDTTKEPILVVKDI